LFQDATITPETVARAAELIEELRPESPLRHRLGMELTEIRKMRQLADA
jgi:hypothetical protein